MEAQDGFFYWRRIELRLIPSISNGAEIDREDWVRPGTVNVTVTNSSGAAQGDATVTVTNQWGRVYTATTAANGTASLSITDPGTWVLSVSKVGFATRSENGSTFPGETSTNTIRLSGGPLAPARLTATVISGTRIDLTWPDVSDETSYRIQRQIGSGSFIHLATTSANVTSYTDGSAVAGTSYTYRISAENSAGSSSFVASPSVTTPSSASTATTTTASGSSTAGGSTTSSAGTRTSSGSTSSGGSSSSGGGGGAPSFWFLAAASSLWALRRLASARHGK